MDEWRLRLAFVGEEGLREDEEDEEPSRRLRAGGVERRLDIATA